MSTALTARQQQRLGLVRPELRQRLLMLLDSAAAAGVTCDIPAYGGTRTLDQQTALYQTSLDEGGGTLAYPVAAPGRSRHEYGAAVDLNIVGGGSNPDGTGTDADYRRLADIAQSIGLTAGYYFATSSDPYHFQLTETLAESIAQWPAVRSGQALTWLLLIVGGVVLARAVL